MTIETSNMARRELLDMMMDSEHGGSSVGSDPRRQRRRQPPSASRWVGPGLSGSFARRWGPEDDEEAGKASNKEGEPALVTAGEMRKRRRRAVARRTARAALGVLVAAALSVAAVLLLTGEGSGIRTTTKGLLDTVLGTTSGEEEAAVVVAAATAEEDEGARRAAETRPWARDGDLGRPDLPDDRMMALRAGGDGREARAVSMLEAKLRRAGEEAAMTAAGLGDGRGMMMTTNTDVPDPLAMAREAEKREERVVTLNGARVSLRDLVRYQAGRPDGDAAGLL